MNKAEIGCDVVSLTSWREHPGAVFCQPKAGFWQPKAGFCRPSKAVKTRNPERTGQDCNMGKLGILQVNAVHLWRHAGKDAPKERGYVTWRARISDTILSVAAFMMHDAHSEGPLELC